MRELALLCVACAACGGVAQTETTGHGGAAVSVAASTVQGAGGSESHCQVPSDCPRGRIVQNCIHDGDCRTTGTCSDAVGADVDPCPGVCACDGTFLCTDVEAYDYDLGLGTNSSCLPCKEKLAELLRATFPPPRDWCTTVTRLRFDNLEPIGLTIVCDAGRNPPIDASTAQTIALAALGPTDAPLTYLGGENEEMLLFWAPPQPTGGIVAVAATGVVPFAGTELAGGTGTILEPIEWLPGSLLAAPCGLHPSPKPSAFGFDGRDGTLLSLEVLAPVVDRIWRTPLPRTFPYELSMMAVLLYAPSQEPFDPSSAEWITFHAWIHGSIIE